MKGLQEIAAFTLATVLVILCAPHSPAVHVSHIFPRHAGVKHLAPQNQQTRPPDTGRGIHFMAPLWPLAVSVAESWTACQSGMFERRLVYQVTIPTWRQSGEASLSIYILYASLVTIFPCGGYCHHARFPLLLNPRTQALPTSSAATTGPIFSRS